MLTGLYYKKSLEIYENLSKEDYLNSTIITDKLPKLELNVDEVMIAEFNEEKIISDGEEEEYVPNYILDLNENIEDIFEGINKEMIIEK